MAGISEIEREQRRQANASALGSFAMEGLAPDEAVRTLMRRHEEGQLTIQQFSSAMDRHAEELLAQRGAMVGAA